MWHQICDIVGTHVWHSRRIRDTTGVILGGSTRSSSIWRATSGRISRRASSSKKRRRVKSARRPCRTRYTQHDAVHSTLQHTASWTHKVHSTWCCVLQWYTQHDAMCCSGTLNMMLCVAVFCSVNSLVGHAAQGKDSMMLSVAECCSVLAGMH